jgi:hypothetical protein
MFFLGGRGRVRGSPGCVLLRSFHRTNGLCYMSIICYMSVIYLVQSPPQEEVTVFGCIEGSFLVSRTGCVRERHAQCIEGPFLVNRPDHARERHVP